MPSPFPADLRPRLLLAGLFVALAGGVASGCTGSPILDGQPLPIGQVQGPGPSSPLAGQEVVVEGVVNAVFEGLGGFFLQSVAGEDDGDPATSDGIFVTGLDAPPSDVAPGLRVRVAGTVEELGSAPPTLTAIRAREVSALEMLGEHAIPVEILQATPASRDDWERLEGMRVRIEAPLTVAGQSGLQRFGELITSFEGRIFQPSELVAPGPELEAMAARNAARTLVLDDGSNEQNPRSVPYLASLPEGWPSHDAPLRAGTELGPLTGVVDVRRSGYLFLPVAPLEIRRQARRPEAPEVAPEVAPDVAPGGAPRDEDLLRIAVLNVENLFNGDGRGGGFPTPRGAQTPELHELQQTKLVATLQAVDADVVALSEVENDGAGPLTAIRQFVDALNAAGPARDWRAVEVAEGPGTDAIRVGILYRESRVTPVGPPVWPDHPIFRWGSRPPLGQAFARPGGAAWLVVANHLKSKGGCPEEGNPNAAPGDFDQGDGQSCWNAHRVTAAGALADWIESDPASLGTGNAVIAGDLNSYGREDPIRLLEDRGWGDAFAIAGHVRPYSYVFQGQAGRLDHVLVPAARAEHLRGAAIWHTNADEFTGFGYEYDPVPTVWRSSDHDLLLVVLRP